MSLPSRGRGLKPCVIWLEGSPCGSLPSRGRGLKPRKNGELVGPTKVASFTGAWIETFRPVARTRGVGVASFTGAWIETVGASLRPGSGRVASFTGAWIETNVGDVVKLQPKSLPSRGRGLKQLSVHRQGHHVTDAASAPLKSSSAIPADDPKRKLTVADPGQFQGAPCRSGRRHLQHPSFRRADSRTALLRTATISRRCLRCSRASSSSPSAAKP